MRGGVKMYRGAAAAARRYVEADHSRADDYYLAEGTGLAERYVATPGGIIRAGDLNGDAYEAWVAGQNPDTGEPRGRLRNDANAVRFVEVAVNGPKTWSLAAALSPEVAEAYDAALGRAAGEIIGWLAEHATTRVGPRGRQVQVPVERIEAAMVRHYTSRAGDPHRHLHLQINARVFAEEKWRGLHTVGVRDSIDAINGIGHATVMCDPGFRTALAQHGFTLDDAGEVVELRPFAGAFSARARQIGQNIARYESDWRAAHPGEEPGRRLIRSWDARAWAQARPDKSTATDGAVLVDEWASELCRLGYRPRTEAPLALRRPGELDRDGVIETVLSRLGAKRSGWNAADVRGEVEQLLAREHIVTPGPVRRELAEDLTARVVAACVPLIDDTGTPDHVRSLTSPEVLRVEAAITSSLAARATTVGLPTDFSGGEWLDPAQARIVRGLAGSHRVVVVEGAAGSGKTKTLAATKQLAESSGHRMVVVTPTLKAARVASRETGAAAFSAAWLAHQHGHRWDEDGQWTRTAATPRADAVLLRGDLLLVDEAGMLDQDTARALLAVADEAGARIAFVGDRHQLPAVGRGGVLDLAIEHAHPTARLTLDTIHRFSDPAYAELSLAMRTGADPEAVFDRLLARGQIRLHSDEEARTKALVDAAAGGALVMADDRQSVSALNWQITRALVSNHRIGGDNRCLAVGVQGEMVFVGSRIATRRNDRDLKVANREAWTVTALGGDGSLRVVGDAGARTLPASYVSEFVELAHAATVHGAQGMTVPSAHFSVGDSTNAMAAYVAMTRGRHANVSHLIADDPAQARQRWVEMFGREQADLGPAHAAKQAAAEAAKYDHPRPHDRQTRDREVQRTLEQRRYAGTGGPPGPDLGL
ncbi:AAA family ATPase [Aeromicrobium sp. Marseille-Q0843]|uniref:AAA family ATPase n=2 Tax=Aeromicrobium phoceense TaxID=2754045 RepID=A0A838XF13_9ACTN|nr:AAA family ATPase [Aeromicrobium phoceense]